MEKLLIITSFGTSYQDTYEKNILAVQRHIAAAFPEWETNSAFTSSIIIKVLAKRGKQVNDLPAALKIAADRGIKEVAILPTHLLCGAEYDKLCAQAEPYRGAFDKLHIGMPLLSTTEDLQLITDIISAELPEQSDRCIALFGHGTYHYVNTVYAALEYMFRQKGRKDIFVGTVEGYPTVDEVMHNIGEGGYKKVLLTPFMLVAGDHAVNDMAGDEDDSWKKIMEAKGLEVEPVIRGLGELEGVRKMYENHARELLAKFE